MAEWEATGERLNGCAEILRPNDEPPLKRGEKLVPASRIEELERERDEYRNELAELGDKAQDYLKGEGGKWWREKKAAEARIEELERKVRELEQSQQKKNTTNDGKTAN